MPLIPASLAFTDDGTPYSPTFDDVYHAAEGGLGQAQHVFLAGNDLPRRWQDRERFVVLETGFGLGLNFLATWAAWRDDPLRCARLHFISCELHPFTVADLAHLHQRWPQFAELSAALRAQWPVLAPGLHRLHLDLERVTLTLPHPWLAMSTTLVHRRRLSLPSSNAALRSSDASALPRRASSRAAW